MNGFLILIVLLGVFWALIVLPRKRRQSSHLSMQDTLAVGDEVITAGGLHGEVREVGSDTLRIEIAPDVVVTLDRRAVAAVAREIDVEVDEPEHEAEPEREHESEPDPEPEDHAGSAVEPR